MEKKCLIILGLKKTQPEDVYALEQISQLYNFTLKYHKKFLLVVDWTWARTKFMDSQCLAVVKNPPHPIVQNQETSVQNLKMAQWFSERDFICVYLCVPGLTAKIIIKPDFQTHEQRNFWKFWKPLQQCEWQNGNKKTPLLYPGSSDSCICEEFWIIKRMCLIFMKTSVFLNPTLSQKNQVICTEPLCKVLTLVIQITDCEWSL